MKKIVLASAVAVASISAAQAAPTVYGKAFLTAEYADINDKTAANKDTSSTKLVSQGSRIGLKGGEPLTANTDLVYQLEYQVNIDDNSQQFTSRNTYLGLANKQYGTLLAGRHDTPFKMAKGNVDLFSDYGSLEIKNTLSGEVRANNVIAYKSPKMANLPVTFMAAVSLDECDANNDDKCLKTAATSTTPAVYADKTNAYSASVAYDQNGVYLGAGFDKDVLGVDTSGWRVAGSADLGKMNMGTGLILGALYQQIDFNTKSDEKAWLISGKYKIANTPWAVKAQYNDTKNFQGTKDRDVTEVALGGEYAFNANAKGHLYAGQVNTKNVKANDRTVVGAGLEYKF